MALSICCSTHKTTQVGDLYASSFNFSVRLVSSEWLETFCQTSSGQEHVFADGSSKVSYENKRTWVEAPTGTLLFYYKDIKQEIVCPLLLEEYGVSNKWVIIMDRRQDSTATSNPTGNSEPSIQVFQEVWFDEGFLIWHFFNYCLGQIVSLFCFWFLMVIRVNFVTDTVHPVTKSTMGLGRLCCDHSALKLESFSPPMNWQTE